MNKPEHAHALRYATEATKLYLMRHYKKQFPRYFENAVLETRPATDDDYYVPPSLVDACVVVESTRFDEIGCDRFGCFPFKEKAEICEETDPVRWVRMGSGRALACQQSCQHHSIDTEWSRETQKCLASNPLKKMLAAMPERLFERASRHVFHGGFDLVDGHLRLNRRYCDAYGLDFVRDDCVATLGQKVGEWLFGTTVVRAAKTGGLAPLDDDLPPVPLHMQYDDERASGRAKRSPASARVDRNLFQEVAFELSVDLGREVSEYAVETFVKRKAPALLTEAVDALAAKLVLKHTIALAARRVGLAVLKAAGKSIGVVTTVYALFELVSAVLDALDPFDYLKVLDKKTLREIDHELDVAYFQDGPVRPEITPEYVWDRDILGEDDRLLYMTHRVEEYLKALETAPPNAFRRKAPQQEMVWSENKRGNDFRLKTLLLAVVCCIFLCVNLLHAWACCLFFSMVFFYRTLSPFR